MRPVCCLWVLLFAIAGNVGIGRSDAQSPSAQPLADSKRFELEAAAAGMLDALEASRESQFAQPNRTSTAM